MTSLNVEPTVRHLATIDDAQIADRPEDAMAQALFAAIVAENAASAVIQVPRVSGRWRTSLIVSGAVLALVASLLLLDAFSRPPPSSAATTAVALKTTSGAAIEGRIPKGAIRNGVINWSKVPTYIPFYAGHRLVGYVEKRDVEHRRSPIEAGPLFTPIRQPGEPRFCNVEGNGVSVYNRSHALIGQLFPGTGFFSEKALRTCHSDSTTKVLPLHPSGSP
jgi:hypothetical protein